MSLATLQVRSQRHRELVDITQPVREAVQRSGVRAGLCCLYVPHTTAGLTINENADPDVAADLLRWAEEALGDERRFRHFEGNAGGHIFSSLFGCSLVVPVQAGNLSLGRWQAIYLVEGDGPRERTVEVMFMASD